MKIVYKSFRLGLTLLILAIGILVIRWQLTTHITVDYVAYWSAARLALAGGNPYSVDEVLKIEQEIGWPANSGQVGLPVSYAHMMYNPPWTIFFILPFGLMDYLTSRAIFFLLCIGIIVYSVDRLWKSFGGGKRHIWLVLLLAFTFPATISLINLGNIAILQLLGIVIFMLCVQKKSFFGAGTALCLVLIKPQSVYLFIIALAIWSLTEKCWKVILGAIVSLLACTGVVLIFVPDVIKEYLALMSMSPTAPWLNATIGSFLRLKYGYGLVWLIYLPIIPGLIWLLWYWIRNHHSWNWDKAVPNLLIVSAVTTPWGWLLDLTLIIPSILYITNQSIYGWNQIKLVQRSGILSFLSLYLIMNAIITFDNGRLFIYPHDLWWFSSFLLICFVGLGRFSRVYEKYPEEKLVRTGRT